MSENADVIELKWRLPFAIYILLPAIASYFIPNKNSKIEDFKVVENCFFTLSEAYIIGIYTCKYKEGIVK